MIKAVCTVATVTKEIVLSALEVRRYLEVGDNMEGGYELKKT